MNLNEAQHRKAAEALFAAERDHAPIEPITATYEDADIEDAYRIAMCVTELKLAAGRTIKGHKIGLTSKAMRSLNNATEPDYGTMFDNWFVPEGTIVEFSRLNRPLVEVELAFVLKHDLPGPSVNAADVIRATDFILPALEIVDSRFSRRGNRGVIDSVCDAASCGLVVLGGNPRRLDQVDIRRIGASLAKNGDIEETGVASAVMGNPINSVAWLANKLHEFGVTMAAGHVVLSGSFIKAIPFGAGDTLTAVFDQLGEVSCTFR
ncbi:MAG TPA: fumarylacetoacetate hydrolase family protein [Dehalococcoidia bacterium]|nr:fumarylacetoacetate hydrolase family protein [Dehalococcoidia bacterium]